MKFETESSSGAGNSSLRGADGDEAIHKEHTQELMSAAQLVVKTAGVNVKDPIVTVCNVCDCPGEPPCPPPCNGVCDTPNCPPCPIVNQLHQKITFGQFDNVSGRGIYFDASRPASVQNQINVVNTNQGRFTSIFPGRGDFLNISIGEFRRNSSVAQSTVDAATGLRINPASVEFASVSFQPTPAPPGTKVNITVNEQRVDIVPRGRKVYMTAQKAFRANGRTIPAGTILIGTLEPGSNVSNPRFGDLSTIRAYSPQTGALMQIFKPGERNSRDCSGGGECMRVDQFRASGANPNLVGSQIRTSFSTSQLFPGVDAHTANTRFLNIQRDLEVNSNMGIYNANFDWQKDILRDDLNANEQVLITQALQDVNLNDPVASYQFLRSIGFAYVRTGDNFVDSLQTAVENQFKDFLNKKLESFVDTSRKNSSPLKTSRNNFIALRNVYQDYMRSKISKNKANKLAFNITKDGDTFNVKPPPPPPTAPTRPSHPGAGPTEPSKPVCNKPKSNACKKKRNKYKNQMKKYRADLKKYNKKLNKYRNALKQYDAAYKKYVADLARHNELYG